MTNPRLLDGFCGAGGAGMGYHRAGFKVTGVDLHPMPRYPFRFKQADALDYIARKARKYRGVHVSPPCQAYSATSVFTDGSYPMLIEPSRVLLNELGVPYVIENVPGAPLINPIELCGCMFPGLGTYRLRLFEFGNMERPPQPEHRPHTARLAKMGRPPAPGEFMHVVGNYSGAQQAKEAMGIDWMTRSEMAESIPPAYTEWVGRYLIKEV